jgi:hypothetical protein
MSTALFLWTWFLIPFYDVSCCCVDREFSSHAQMFTYGELQHARQTYLHFPFEYPIAGQPAQKDLLLSGVHEPARRYRYTNSFHHEDNLNSRLQQLTSNHTEFLLSEGSICPTCKLSPMWGGVRKVNVGPTHIQEVHTARHV